MYRGLPCPYASSLLTGTYLLTGGNLVVLRIVAMIMILFMVDQGFYPHDKVLESQLWKKMVYAGGKFLKQTSTKPWLSFVSYNTHTRGEGIVLLPFIIESLL